MTKDQEGGLLLKKQRYEQPDLQFYRFERDDVITTSGYGTMSWDWNGEWVPGREDTFID